MLGAMIDADDDLSLSNPGPNTLLVWLEPWAEEFVVPARSTVTMRPSIGCTLGEVEWTKDHLVIWANAKTVEVFIDGIPQKSCSAVIPRPDSMTKEMLNIALSFQPSARLGGAYAHAIIRPSLWERIWRLARGLPL